MNPIASASRAGIYSHAMIVAIDGPAGAGKSTVARGAARALGFAYLDSGALYRTVALAALEHGVDPEDGPTVARLAESLHIDLVANPGGATGATLNGRDVSAAIRDARVTAAASRVAAQPEVRAALIEFQRDFLQAGDSVAEGRDIGTVVAPGAELKVFLVADPAERARRRAAELRERGEDADPDAVRAEIERRDERDSSRAAAPLRPAPDAVEVDTTGLSIEAAVARVVELVRERQPDR